MTKATKDVKQPAQWEIDAAKRKARILALIEELGLRVESVFVPLSAVSEERRKAWNIGNGEPLPTLNWTITIYKSDRAILLTDFTAGVAHCPGYNFPGSLQIRDALIAWECEHGKAGRIQPGGISARKGAPPLMPDACDVIHSIVSDSDAMGYPTFESWADYLGYDTDSRKAELVYRACLEVALKLRDGIGDEGLRALSEAFQDY